jgi:DNA-binding SARP family transcriptional activator/ATP/maltotriose-dependent transcriptional regulator MalT
VAGLGTIVRRRLIDPCLNAPVLDVQAPTGYGKSILSEQLIAAWELPPLRVQLRTETGPDDLVDQLRRAARRTGLGDVASLLTGECANDELDSVVTFCAAGFDLAVLIDDAQMLSDEAFEHISAFAADLPDSCRVAVCRRSSDARQLVGPVHHLSIDDLRMTTAEVADVIASVVGDSAAGSLVADVLGVTAGWPAAVAVAASHLRDDPKWSPSQRSAGARLLGALIGDLIGQEHGTIERLVALPLLDRFTAEAVAGPGAFDALRHSGLPYRTDGEWITVPDSIRDAVLARAHRAPVERDALRAVTERYAAAGELPAAVHVLVDANLLDDVAELLGRQHWTDLEGLGLAQVDQLLDLLKDASPPAVAELTLRAVWAAEGSHPTLRTKFFDRLASQPPVSPVMSRAIEAERVRFLSRTMNPAEAIVLAEWVIADTPVDEMVTRGRVLLASAHAHAVTGTPDGYEAADAQFAQAAQLFDILHEHRWQAEALARLGYSVLYHEGRPHEAALRMEAALALLPSGDLTRAAWLSSYADVLDTIGRDIEARAAINEAVAIGERLHDHAVIGLGLWSRGWMAGRRGDAQAVRTAVRDVEALRPGWLSSHSGVEFYGSMADHLVALDDIEGMRYCEGKARHLHGRLQYQEAVDMMAARIEAHVGDPKEALVLLDRLESSIGAQANTRWVRRLEAALACLRLGERDRARQLVEEAFRIVRGMGVPDLPARFEGRMLNRLAELDVADSSAAIGDNRIEVSVLGTFAVRQGYHDVTPPSGNPSTLVKLLVLRRRLTVDAVIDLLWPDADIDTGRARLRNTINRLRARTGAIVERQDDSLMLASTVITDLDAFEAVSADALGADAAQRVGLARQAISLYPGDLLPGDVFDDWAAAPRERLLRRFVALVDLVADAAEGEGSLDEAARLLDIGITADPLDEQRYVRLGRLLKLQGRIGASRLVAERGIAVFAELGLESTRELRELV